MNEGQLIVENCKASVRQLVSTVSLMIKIFDVCEMKSISAPICQICKVLEQQLFITSQVSRFFRWCQLWFLTGELLVEIGNIFKSALKKYWVTTEQWLDDVHSTYNCRDKRRWNSSHQQVLPVHVSEEGLLLDIFRVPFCCSKSSLRILSQKLKKVKVELCI